MARPEKTPTLMQSATSGARIVRQPQLVQFIVDGNGAMVTTSAEFNQIEKWASARNGCGSRLIDRGKFIDQFQVLISRPGSFVGTRGSTKPLEDLCKLMLAGGYDLGEWHLPPDLKDIGKPAKPQPPIKKAAPEEPPQLPAAEASPPSIAKPLT